MEADQRALRDIMSLLALPALWVGKDEETILELMAGAVGSIAPVSVIYAHIQFAQGQAKTPILKLGKQPWTRELPADWQSLVLASGPGDVPTALTSRVDSPVGPLNVVGLYMGAGRGAEKI